MKTSKSNPRRRRHTSVSDLLTARQHAQAIGTIKKALSYCGIKATVKGTGGTASDRGVFIDVSNKGYWVYLYPGVFRVKLRSLKGTFQGEESIGWSASLGDEFASEIEEITGEFSVGTAAVKAACYIIERYLIHEGHGRWEDLRSTKKRGY